LAKKSAFFLKNQCSDPLFAKLAVLFSTKTAKIFAKKLEKIFFKSYPGINFFQGNRSHETGASKNAMVGLRAYLAAALTKFLLSLSGVGRQC
jgi:hypothetical protein